MTRLFNPGPPRPFGCCPLQLQLLLVTLLFAQARGNGEGSVRLSRGINSESGYVEILHAGQWGRVCDTGWEHSAAHVVCKQLGYSGAKFPPVVFPEPPNAGLPVLLDSVQCTGRETALASCQHAPWGQVADGCQTTRVQCTQYAAQYIGCFNDTKERLMPDYSALCVSGQHDPRCSGCDHTDKACDSQRMTPALCTEICCTANNFTYAGLQAGDECFCGAAGAPYDRVGRLTSAHCNTRCSGDPQWSCGADYKLDVYNCSSGCEVPTVDEPSLVPEPALVQGRLYDTGEVIAFACVDGLVLVGSRVTVCQPGGLWNDTVPDCVVATCPYPTSVPENGQYLPVAASYQPTSTVDLACGTGYRHDPDSTTLTCGADGSWTPGQHSCIVIDCGPLASFPNAVPSTDSSTFGTEVTFTCEAGYQPSGNAAGKTCDETGHWVGADPLCTDGSTCGAPPLPANGQFSPVTESYQLADALEFSCFWGYRLEGAANITCQGGGTWSDAVPSCEAVDCGPLPDYPYATPVNPATVFATSVTFRCDDLYQFANDRGTTPFKTCEGNGLWVGTDPVCQPIACPPLLDAYEHAAPSDPSTAVGTEVTFTCEAGYQPPPDAPAVTKTCNDEGVWEGTDPICEVVGSGCPPLPDYPAAVASSESSDVGTVVNFTCASGTVSRLDPPARPSKTCSADGLWVGTDPDCVVDCGPLQAYPHAIPITSQTTVDTEVSFQCEAGYQLVGGPPALTCTQSGWQGTDPSCQAVSCGPPEAPSGVLVNGSDFGLNGTVTFGCQNETETVDGNETATCLASGEWSSAVPSCVPAGENTTDVMTTTTDGVPKGADTAHQGVPLSVWILLLLCVTCLILLVASYVIYRVHTNAYYKYKNENRLDEDASTIDGHGVPMNSIAVIPPSLAGGHVNYGLSAETTDADAEEDVDTGVASYGSDLQDVSLGSESHYPHEGASDGPDGGSHRDDSGTYAFDAASLSADEAGPSAERRTEAGKAEDKDFVDSVKDKFDNCVIQ